MTDSQSNHDKSYPVSQIPLGAMAERMGITILEASVNRVVCQMPVEGNTQPFGLLNGGASMALAETLGSIGATFLRGHDASSAYHFSGTDQIIVGFAAETGDSKASVLEHGIAKLQRKGCDLLVVNQVGPDLGFGTDDNEVTILTREPATEIVVDRTSKTDIAHAIWDAVIELQAASN